MEGWERRERVGKPQPSLWEPLSKSLASSSTRFVDEEGLFFLLLASSRLGTESDPRFLSSRAAFPLLNPKFGSLAPGSLEQPPASRNPLPSPSRKDQKQIQVQKSL